MPLRDGMRVTASMGLSEGLSHDVWRSNCGDGVGWTQSNPESTHPTPVYVFLGRRGLHLSTLSRRDIASSQRLRHKYTTIEASALLETLRSYQALALASFVSLLQAKRGPHRTF